MFSGLLRSPALSFLTNILLIGLFSKIFDVNSFYENLLLRYHEVGPGETIRLDIWNGWANILNHAMKGDVRRFTNSLSKVEKVAKVRFTKF